MATTNKSSSVTPTTKVVYGELSILGYNGYIPKCERSGRPNKSKFLLCKRPTANGIQKSKHYIVEQPQATRAIQDKDLHSISYTFSRSQTIIVEYRQDETTDMFQIGRSSEEPIDFVVMDTLPLNCHQNPQQQPQQQNHDHAVRSNRSYHMHIDQASQQQQAYLLNNYSQHNNIPSNLTPVLANHFRNQDGGSIFLHPAHTSNAQQQLLVSSARHSAAGNNVMEQHGPASSGRHSSGNHHHQHRHHHQHNNTNNNNNNNNSAYNNNNNLLTKRSHTTQSTISRFACRILVDREPPYTARIYAAGFDSSNNIFLGEKATKWEHNNTIDGLTTNGVLLMHPKQCEYGGVWREVSVDGGIYAIRESRSATQKGKRIEGETNILQDGTLIDLCGATLLWRSVDGFRSSPTKKTLEEKIDMLNALRPQCPVGLNTLVIPRKPILPSSVKLSHQPYVYVKCGHVQGYHDWGTTEKLNQRTCPICLSVGTVAKLCMGLEPSFYVDSGPLTHVFNPCGHMASERTVKYWCSIKIPHGTHFFHSVCPFCAIPLAADDPPLTKIIFQDDLD